MFLIIRLWFGSDQEDCKTFPRSSPTEAKDYLDLARSHGIEDDKGQIWTVDNVRLDHGSLMPYLDIFLMEA